MLPPHRRREPLLRVHDVLEHGRPEGREAGRERALGAVRGLDDRDDSVQRAVSRAGNAKVGEGQLAQPKLYSKEKQE